MEATTINANTGLQDRKLERLIATAMNARRARWLAKLKIEARKGVVTLSGYVSTFEEKKIATESTAHVRGVQRVIDQLLVDATKVGTEAKPISAPSAVSTGLAVLIISAAVGLAVAGWWWLNYEPPAVHAPVFRVEGTATLAGTPLEGATLVFHLKQPQEGAPSPRATVAYDGKVTVTTYEKGDGAPAGEYVVTAEWRKLVSKGGEFEPGPNLLPAKYASPQSSPLLARVLEGPINRVQFVLTK